MIPDNAKQPTFTERLYSAGCLFVLLGFALLVYLAFTSSLAYFAAAAALAFGWFKIPNPGVKRMALETKETLNASFATHPNLLPALKRSNSYGFPSFILTFASEAELRQAEQTGCIRAFKQAIQSSCGHIGTKQNPFNADLAVYSTYEGQHPASKNTNPDSGPPA